MQIKSLKLVNFRNYTQAFVEPDEGLCVLTGENAAGKTNVLEALFLSALGRSHRTPRDQELLRDTAEAGYVGVVLDTAGGTRQIECRLAQGERKRMQIDGKALTRSGELIGCLNVVLFAPEDLMLVKGGPAERRRFLDMEISQLRPAYYYTLQQYNAVLRQRNALLKEFETCSSERLFPWDEQLARLGTTVTLARAQFLERLSAAAAEMHRILSDGREELLVAYRPNMPPAEPSALCAAMLEALGESAQRDQFRGYTSVGPHRDDIALFVGGTDVRVYGSQGQQRTTVLSLKLSEVELMRAARGETPVLLLDDVFSELDLRRQKMLLRAAAGCQTFITCTDLSELTGAGADRMQVLRVAGGSITEV